MQKYILSIGLFDKDTKQQKIATTAAASIVDRIAKYSKLEGYTITEGQGVYTHEDGTRVHEPTLLVSVLDFTGEEGEKIRGRFAPLAKKMLNQESIALEHATVSSALI